MRTVLIVLLVGGAILSYAAAFGFILPWRRPQQLTRALACAGLACVYVVVAALL